MRRRASCLVLTTLLLSGSVSAQMAAAGDPAMTRRGEVAADAAQPPMPPTGQAGAPGGPPPGGPPPGGPPPGGPPPGMGGAPVTLTAALKITDGRYDRAAGMPAAVHGGDIGDTFAHGIAVDSTQGMLNGVLVTGGSSAFTLSDAKVTMSGTGKSDFDGIGAGAMVTGGVMVLRNVTIDMSGAVRSATVANDHAVMKVYDSTITAHGGALPPGYVHHIGPGMMEVPAPLGITGTARANLTMGQSETYFYHTRITADGWGALSTDATGGYVYLEANDCDIRVLNSGYGAYADFGAHVAVNKSRMDVATYGAIAAGSGEVRFTDVTGRAGRNAMMIHSVGGDPMEVGKFAMTGGSLDTGATGVLVKSANADVVLDHATLRPANGILVQGIVNDDSHRTAVNGAPVPGIKVSLRNGRFTGGIVMQDNERPMMVTLTQATLNGPIQGAIVAIDAGSRWTASANSTVTLASGTDASRIDAPAGVTVIAHAASGGATGSSRLPGGGTLTMN